jgi:hypothetical protein
MIDYNSENNAYLDDSLNSFNIFDNNIPNFKITETIHEELNKKDDMNNMNYINKNSEQNCREYSDMNNTHIKNKIFNMTKKQKKVKKKVISKSNKKINISIRKKRKINISINKIFIPDKYIKKIRIKLLNSIVDFINKKIKIFFNNIGRSICIKQLLSINKSILYKSSVENDKEFLNKKLKEIFSQINNKYTNYLSNKNEETIEYLINLEDKGKYFQELFELSFLDCLNHICDGRNNELLNGLDKIDEILANEKKWLDEDEKEIYKIYFNHYESIVISKKKRKSKTSLKSVF